MSGFGQYLTGEPTDAARRTAPGYRKAFGRHLDGSQDAPNLKRSQLAAQRRARIREAQRAGTATYDRNGRPVDPLADRPDLVEENWAEEFGPDDGDAA